jgi:hypothetical protein
VTVGSIVAALLDGPHRAVGANVSGSVPISERVLNQVAAAAGGRVYGVRVLEGNRITASARGPFGTSLPLDVTIVSVDAGLDVTLELNGLSGKALMLVASWLPQATRDSAGRLRVAVGALPQLAPHRRFLRLVQSVVVTTTPGVLVVNLVAGIRE